MFYLIVVVFCNNATLSTGSQPRLWSYGSSGFKTLFKIFWGHLFWKQQVYFHHLYVLSSYRSSIIIIIIIFYFYFFYYLYARAAFNLTFVDQCCLLLLHTGHRQLINGMRLLAFLTTRTKTFSPIIYNWWIDKMPAHVLLLIWEESFSFSPLTSTSVRLQVGLTVFLLLPKYFVAADLVDVKGGKVKKKKQNKQKRKTKTKNQGNYVSQDICHMGLSVTYVLQVWQLKF